MFPHINMGAPPPIPPIPIPPIGGMPPLPYGSSSCFLSNLIISSILKIVIAASVANLIHLILLTIGSKTPAFLLFSTFPLIKSNPHHLKLTFYSSSEFYEAWCKALNLETNSVAS